MNAIREIAGFLRWRLIPVRYAGKVRRSLPGIAPAPTPPRSAKAGTVARDGWAKAPDAPAALVDAIRAKYWARGADVVPKAGGHPFTNLFTTEDIAADDPVCQIAFAPEVLDIAHDYLGGRVRMDSIQLLYSWPTGGDLTASQNWHKDYGDSTSFHYIMYVNDVVDEEDGPFVFVDKADTLKIRQSPIIRRLNDASFAAELGKDEVETFYGKAGEAIYVDPSVCYHYGSRCKRPRLALFVTFFTDTPFVGVTDLIAQSTEPLAEAAAAIRPDLAPDYLRTIVSPI